MKERPLLVAPCESVGIAGLGLIGGSIALGVRAAWPGVGITVFDRPDRVAEGRARGLVDHAADEASGLASCDLVVLAVPLAVMDRTLGALGAMKTTSVVTDVGSAKRHVLRAASDAGLSRFVGGHPMAGAERSGLEHARPDLFRGRPWLLMSGATPDAAAIVEALVAALGAEPRWTSADVHDRTMAYVSHLPQVLATTLMNVARDAVGTEGLSCAGPAFLEMTRLAASSPEVWEGILAQNADCATEAIQAFVRELPTGPGLRSADWVTEAFGRAAGSVDRAVGRTGRDE